jgi:hypothetical protein
MRSIGSNSTIAALLEAVLGVAVVGEDDDAVAALLQAHGGVDNETLGAADAQVWVEEDEGALGAAVGIAAGIGGGGGDGVCGGYGTSLGGHGCGVDGGSWWVRRGPVVEAGLEGEQLCVREAVENKTEWGLDAGQALEGRGGIDPFHWLASHVRAWWWERALKTGWMMCNVQT